MSDRTKIEWADATLNNVIGCTPVSSGCDHCYARRTAHRMQANPNPAVVAPYAGTEADGEWTGRVNLVPERLAQVFRWAKPRRIFVAAQSDLFHKQVPDEFVAATFAVAAATPRHTYLILTKRAGRMRSLLSDKQFRRAVLQEASARYGASGLEWPLPNVVVGVSAETQHWVNVRVPVLLDTPAATRFVSIEPCLGPISLYDNTRIDREDAQLDWVIVGGESGPNARPMHPAWVRRLRDECQPAARYDGSSVAFCFKQWGQWVPAPADDPSPADRIVFADGSGSVEVAAATASDPRGAVMRRVGKRAAGRKLDDVIWDEFPS